MERLTFFLLTFLLVRHLVAGIFQNFPQVIFFSFSQVQHFWWIESLYWHLYEKPVFHLLLQILIWIKILIWVKKTRGVGPCFCKLWNVFLFLWKIQISNSFFQLHKLKCLKTFHLCVQLPTCVFLNHTDRELIVWWTPSWLCLQHHTQTPSTGLQHPSSTLMNTQLAMSSTSHTNSKHRFTTSFLHPDEHPAGYVFNITHKLQALVYNILPPPWWTPSWLCLQHHTQTPSTGLQHPSSTLMNTQLAMSSTLHTNSKHWFTTSFLHPDEHPAGYVFNITHKLQALVYNILPPPWWTPSWLCLQHCTQTPSTGLQHPSSTHCHSWLHHRSWKTVS